MTFTGTAVIVGGSSDVQLSIDILQDLEIEDDETFTVTLNSVTPNAQLGTSSTATVTIEDDDAAVSDGEVLYRVNAGGGTVAATDGGIEWGGDTGDFGAVGNSPYLVAVPTGNTTFGNDSSSSYAGTVDSTAGVLPAGAPLVLFDTERGDRGAGDPTMQWSFPVVADHGLAPGDEVEIRLYLAEIFNGVVAAGGRVFDVTVDGVLPAAFDDIDPFADAGGAGNVGSVRSAIVQVDADGNIDLNFLNGAENPAIKAIEIVAVNGDVYTPPADDLFGVAIELSDSGLAPTDAGELAEGEFVMSATQEGEGAGTNGVRDRDYFSVTVADGKILTGIFLDSYNVTNTTSPDGFFAFQEGEQVTTDPTTGANVADLTGAIIYGASDVGTNLLDTMRAGFNDSATGNDLPAFDQKLTGDLSFWLNQGAGPNTPTLRFVVEDDPDATVPGAYQPNADGNFIFEAEDGLNNGAGGFEIRDASALEAGHAAPSGGEYLETTQNNFGGNEAGNGETLTYKFTAAADGFIRINLISSYQGVEPTEENDAWTKIQLDGVDIPALNQSVNLVSGNGFYKTYQSGGQSTDFTLANKNVDNNGQPIVVPVEAGKTYDFLLSERSAGFEIDKIALEFFDTQPGPSAFGNFNILNGQPLSPQVPIEPVDPVGEAVLTINQNSDNIEVSNFGNGSFSITNTGTKDIDYIEIDVTDAILPDAVFDPFGVAGDSTAKPITVPDLGGTGLIGGTLLGNGSTIFGQDTVGTNYIGTGGISGFEKIRLDFADFNPGETISFGADMDPNSIAGSAKGTLDSGATLDGAGGGAGTDNWDVGGVSGAELAGSTFTVGYSDATTSTGQLIGQGAGQQSGAKALSTQDAAPLSVTLDVNGIAAGGEGTYDADGPTVTVQGPAGETARIVLAKGFVVPFENNFADTDPYKAQLDAQLATLAASGFPANNVVEFQYVDVLLDGTVQDVTSLFDFADVDAFDLSTVGLDEGQLPLGFAASVVDPATDLPLGPVTSPVHLTFSEEPEADLSVTKTVSDETPAFGDDVTFTVTVSNDGGDGATGVVVKDLLPDGYSFVGAAPSVGTYDETTGLWTVGDLAVGSATLAITATVLEEGAPTPDAVVYRINVGGNAQPTSDASVPGWSADERANTPATPSTVVAGATVTGGTEVRSEREHPRPGIGRRRPVAGRRDVGDQSGSADRTLRRPAMGLHRPERRLHREPLLRRAVHWCAER